MAIPYPPPDPVELAEYLAQYLRREIKAGKFTQADLQDIPEIGCLEQVAAMLKERREEVPRAIADVLGQAAEAGRFLSWISACKGTRQLGLRRATTPVTKPQRPL